jgi:stage II sporulation protein GA (sporulation sigma-E factor processing peptidase)
VKTYRQIQAAADKIGCRFLLNGLGLPQNLWGRGRICRQGLAWLRPTFPPDTGILSPSFFKGGRAMTIYPDLIVLLNFLVNGLLLMGADRLTGHTIRWRRCALAALFGSAYAGMCVLPGFRFLGNILWRMAVLGGMSVIAYGWGVSTLRRGAVFVLLSMALGGMAMGMGGRSLLTLLPAAAGVAVLCALGIKSPIGMVRFQPVELHWRDKRVKLTALVDTGNTLRDPITGGSVLVVGMDVGRQLGISRELIQDPVTLLGRERIPGAMLVPYRAVGQPGGILLMIRCDQVLLNGKTVSPMVAFSPEKIGEWDGYQALAGGCA